MIGRGSVKKPLSETDIHSICTEAFESLTVDGKRVLFIIPDHTRSGPMDMMFRIVYRLLAQRVKKLDFLIALGTHPPMGMKAIYDHMGISAEDHQNQYPRSRFFNHHWDNADQLQKIGTISQDDVAHISGGLMTEAVDVNINKMIMD